MKKIFLKEGLRMFRRNISVRLKGLKRYNGNAEQISKQIINACWNKHFFQTSNGHFCEFWSRDFGWCVKALDNMGYRNEILATLMYAIKIFRKNGNITTTISPRDVAFDFPYPAIDSLAYFLMSIRIADAKELVEKNHDFLDMEIKKIFEKAVDRDSGLVKKHARFSSMKDHSRRVSSCYDNVMLGLISREAKMLGLDNPFKCYSYRKLIKEKFWREKYFIDDLSGEDVITGDANVFPFWTGLFDDASMIKNAIKSIHEAGLDKPFPLKYSANKTKQEMISYNLLAKNYEDTAIWSHMAPLFIEVVATVNKKKAREYINQYGNVIEKNMNYIEVFDNKGKPYNSMFYYADDSMLWCSIWLDLKKRLG